MQSKKSLQSQRNSSENSSRKIDEKRHSKSCKNKVFATLLKYARAWERQQSLRKKQGTSSRKPPRVIARSKATKQSSRKGKGVFVKKFWALPGAPRQWQSPRRQGVIANSVETKQSGEEKESAQVQGRTGIAKTKICKMVERTDKTEKAKRNRV